MLDIKNDKITYSSFLSLKLGLSSVTLGEYNFMNVDNPYSNNFGIETGANLLFGLTHRKDWKRDYFMSPYLDNELIITNRLIHKIKLGYTFEYSFYVPTNNYMKYSCNIDYNKYFINEKTIDFFNINFSIHYFMHMENNSLIEKLYSPLRYIPI